MTEKPFRFETFEYIPTPTIFSEIHSDGNSFDNTFKGYVRVHKNDAKELVDLLNKQQKIIKQQGDYWRKLESEVIGLEVKNKELEHRIETLKEVIKSEPFARADGDTTTVQTDKFIQICQENNELKHRIRELEHDV